ncbi:AGZA family xanthine/uracil permease-like MFS transporter [Metabacillus crassostreae]|uniref:NCS2 family permease n=1 Tax=Metabacillus crassostreae TaxID=929098 RepID=UPI0019564E7D|nr:NCS2 family permease [Metabacillus crassostreae]MBM7603587.1 AGZA family xanthine/uracil permease-like MFS transporter [Metabacillus crassostreae]
MDRFFKLKENSTTFKTEILAGTVSFFTIVYIVVVNASILSDAGIPLEAGIIATVLTSIAGCFIMGLWGNTPIILVPGMGVNALFTYTIVLGMDLTWQEGLAVVFVSGILFTIIAFTKLATIISESIPHSLKEAITVGIGFFLTFIGLQKGGIVVLSEDTYVALGDFSETSVLLTIITLLITVALFAKQIPGNFLISIILGTLLAAMFGGVSFDSTTNTIDAFHSYFDVLGAMSFERLIDLTFWTATFSLTMVIVFENIGLVFGQVHMINRPKTYKRSLQANALSTITSGVFGSSPTVSTVETAAGITAGGRTGLTSIATGTLFLTSLLFLPFIKVIPDSAIAPILILIGSLMIQNIKHIDLDDFSESFPAFLIIALIPLTYSIVDGMAFGFIMYPLLKIILKRTHEVKMPLYFIALLFLLNFIFHSLH